MEPHFNMFQLGWRELGGGGGGGVKRDFNIAVQHNRTDVETNVEVVCAWPFFLQCEKAKGEQLYVLVITTFNIKGKRYGQVLWPTVTNSFTY